MRKTVRRFASCLDRLPVRQRRVLVLRAGIAGHSASTRRRVGIRIDVATPRVARIERRGLRRLRAIGRDGGCGPAAGTTAAAAPSGAPSQPPAAGSASEADAATGEVTESRSALAGDSADSATGGGPIDALLPAQEEASDWSIGAVLLGLLLLAYALRREFGPGGPSPGRVRR